MVLILECRSHLDLGDLPNLLAAELGVMTVRLERAVRSLDGVARVHVNRWGDGSAHLHLWFLARPYGRLQLRGTFLSLWDDILPVIPEAQWRQNLAHVAAWLAEFGGRPLAEPPHLDWQSPSTVGESRTADAAAAATAAAEAAAAADAAVTNDPPASPDATAPTADEVLTADPVPTADEVPPQASQPPAASQPPGASVPPETPVVTAHPAASDHDPGAATDDDASQETDGDARTHDLSDRMGTDPEPASDAPTKDLAGSTPSDPIPSHLGPSCGHEPTRRPPVPAGRPRLAPPIGVIRDTCPRPFPFPAPRRRLRRRFGFPRSGKRE
jgi:hypothetical protein